MGRVVTAPGTAPVSFTAAVFESVGLDRESVQQFRTMLATEHNPGAIVDQRSTPD